MDTSTFFLKIRKRIFLKEIQSPLRLKQWWNKSSARAAGISMPRHGLAKADPSVTVQGNSRQRQTGVGVAQETP